MSDRPHTQAWTALGTSAGLVLAGASHPASARDAVERELAAIDEACSRFRDDSELMMLNAAGDRPRPVSALLWEAIEVALRAAELTGGLVDPTVGGALVLSGYDRDFADVRGSRVRRIRAVPAAGWRTLELDAAARTVRVPAGVRLDLGATAKALAADRAVAAALVAGRARGALVNLGGDIATAGEAPDGGWLVRVTDRHDAAPDAPGQTVSISSGGLATSSVAVRRWRRRGETAHHIVDPRSGRPAAERWRTVSVTAAGCVDANIASTAAIVLGERAVAWLEQAGLPARLVGPDGVPAVVCGWPAAQAVAA
jgi:thiamine biosynthesis lipoprotein